MHSSRRRTLTPARCALLALLAVGCSSGNGDGAGTVVATTTIWADVTEQVACGEVEVESLVPAGADAHSHEPSVRDADDLRGASLVVANGLGLEGHLHDALESAGDDGVQVHEVAGSLDLEPDADPHVWMDPLLVAEAVPGIAAALGEVDDLGVAPADLDRCASAYVEELTGLADEVERRFAAVPAAQRRLVTDHEALGHFAERFDLDVVGSVVPSTDSLAEANPRDLDELEATMRAEGVRVVVVDHGSSHDLAEALASRLGGQAAVVELFTESIGAEGGPQSYVELVRADADLLIEALS